MDHLKNKRIQREKKTLGAMFSVYCRLQKHADKVLCEDCEALLTYAFKRLDHCTLAAHKPTCRMCPIHCYASDKREAIRQVMRFSGPRMMLFYPILAIGHLFDEIRDKCALNLKN